MASLDAYITELTNFKNDLPKTVVKIGVRNEQHIVRLQNERHKNDGLDANGNLIGGGIYAQRTIRDKIDKDQTISHVTLEDTGAWHSDMFVSGKDMLEINNRNASLTSTLISGGGKGENPPYLKDIIGLTERETVYVAEYIIEPDIQKEIDKLPNVID